MYLIEKIVIKDGVNADTTVTINKYTGEVSAINALIVHPNIPNTRGIATYAIVDNKPVFNFSGVGANEMWIYINGVGFTPGGITTFEAPNYEGVISTTEMASSYNEIRTVTVNKIGLFNVGNIVRITLKKPNPFIVGQFTYNDNFFEITAINTGTNQISIRILGVPTYFIGGTVVEWKFKLVATDKIGMDWFLLPFKKIVEDGVYLYEPSVTTYTYIESGMGLLGGKRRVYVKKQSSLIDIQLIINVSLEENIPVYLTNITPKTISGTDSTPIRLTCSGCTFVNGESTIYLHSYDAGTLNNANKLTSATIIRQGTVIYLS